MTTHPQTSCALYTDGSSRGNPGPGGWGIVVIAQSSIVHERGMHEIHTTNNRMELCAAIAAVRFLLENPLYTHATIYADSAYVLGGVTSWIVGWEKNGWKTATKKEVLNQDLWKDLIALVRATPCTLTWEKVKGHAGNLYNERADTIATLCATTATNHIL
jgi:ribonuclease HI